MSPHRSLLPSVVLMLIQVGTAQAVDATTSLRAEGQVLADNFSFYSGSPVSAFDALASHFGMTPATKNDGDRNSDGVIDNADLGIWAADYGKLVPRDSGTSASPHDMLFTTKDSYLYAATWLDSDPSSQTGFAANVKLFDAAAQKVAVTGAVEAYSKPSRWNVCTTNLIVGSTPPARSDLLGVIGQCDSDPQNWQTPTIVARPQPFPETTAPVWLWDTGTTTPGKVVLFRHQITPLRSKLTLTPYFDPNDPNQIKVVIDPDFVSGFQLDFAFDANQVVPIDEANNIRFVEPYAGVDVGNITSVGQTSIRVINDINGALARGAIALPGEADIFELTFQRQPNAGDDIDAYNFAVFAQPDDFVRVGSTEPNVPPTTIGSDLIEPDVVGSDPLFLQTALQLPFDVDGNGLIDLFDVDAAREANLPWRLWFSALQDDPNDPLGGPLLRFGDLNGDRQVDFADLIEVQIHQTQQTLRYTEGDLNGDMIVDEIDLRLVELLSNQAFPAEPVPEPASLALLLCGCLAGRAIVTRCRPW